MALVSVCLRDIVPRSLATIDECFAMYKVPRLGRLALGSVWLGTEYRDGGLALVFVCLGNGLPR